MISVQIMYSENFVQIEQGLTLFLFIKCGAKFLAINFSNSGTSFKFIKIFFSVTEQNPYTLFLYSENWFLDNPPHTDIPKLRFD